jgi:hypothetical protein
MSDQENPMRNDNTWKGEDIHSTGKPYHEGALGQLQRDFWEMRKDYKTDQLVWEQDMLNANRRIEALETLISGGIGMARGYSHRERIDKLEQEVEKNVHGGICRIMNEDGQFHHLSERVAKLEERLKDSGLATSFVKDAWRKDINERMSAIEKLTCIKGNENANDITSATARVAANEARIKALEDRLETVWIAPINALKERCFELEHTHEMLSKDNNATNEQHEGRIEALETYRMDSNAVEARQDDDINRLKGRVGDAHGRIERIENKNVLKRIEALEKSVEDRERPTMNWRFNAIDHQAMTERMDRLETSVASLKLLIPPPQLPCQPDTKAYCTCGRELQINSLVAGGGPTIICVHPCADCRAQPPCPPEEKTDGHCDCVVGSAYPCMNREARIDVTQCIYYDKGVCDYKRNHGNRPPKAHDAGCCCDTCFKQEILKAIRSKGAV